ncbi:phosphorylase family protein [Nitrosospira briensis]|uniref:phosphorylase family protein n=1 Tax=Nitrosospira briensis TaxID=35799 RepID=UPI00046A3E48|nr:chemotaxis protein CheY [Nitrosospira briensis]
MKILLVDDDREKSRVIAETVLSVPGVSSHDIEYVTNVIAAKRAIMKTRFDLVILDINLPPRPEDRVVVGAGLDVLNFIKQNHKAKEPAYLFGFTAHEDGVAIASKEFSSPLWKLLRFSHRDGEWKTPLREAITYLQKSSHPPYVSDGSTYHYDLAIFVALEGEELASILKLDGSWSRIQVEHDHTQYYKGCFVGPKGEVSVVATSAPRMGMPAAAVTASKLINSFRPRFVAVAGICAGVRTKTEMGDILIADPCFDWGGGKWIKHSRSDSIRFVPAAYQWRLDEPLRVAARTVAEMPGLLARIHEQFPGEKPNTPPRVLIDAMASGASVLQATTMVDDVRGHHKNLVGIEMESYAIFTAAEYASEPRPKCIAIKSVCDFGDEDKSDFAHSYAAHTSANFLYEFAINSLVLDQL